MSRIICKWYIKVNYQLITYHYDVRALCMYVYAYAEICLKATSDFSKLTSPVDKNWLRLSIHYCGIRQRRNRDPQSSQRKLNGSNQKFNNSQSARPSGLWALRSQTWLRKIDARSCVEFSSYRTNSTQLLASILRSHARLRKALKPVG